MDLKFSPYFYLVGPETELDLDRIDVCPPSDLLHVATGANVIHDKNFKIKSYS